MTENLQIRSMAEEDLTMVLAWRNHPEVRRFMFTQHEISLAEHLAWWSRIQASADDQYLMYEYQSAPLGIIAFNGINGTDHNASWAFYASPEAPMGTGSRMEYLALEHAFSGIRLHKLCCEVLAFNAPVIKLHEKFGFKVECIFREQHRMENSKVDVYRLGMLALEWHNRRGAMLSRILHFSKS